MRDLLGLGGLRQPLFWKDVLVEIVCSMILLTFLTCNMVEYSKTFDVTPTHAGLVMALIVCAIIETFGHMSGAHMNPAVTFTLTCRGDISPIKGVVYTIAQCVGGALGSTLVFGLMAAGHRDMLSPFQPAEELGPVRGMLIEAVLAFVLCTVVQGVTDPARGPACNIPGIPIGFTVGVNIMIGMTYTGAAFNPIIAFGPAVVTMNFKHHWIYWAGAYIGAFFAVAIYGSFRLITSKYKKEKVKPTEIAAMEKMIKMLQDCVEKQKELLENGDNNNKESLLSSKETRA